MYAKGETLGFGERVMSGWMLYFWYHMTSTVYGRSNDTPSKDAMNFPRKLIVPASPICCMQLGERRRVLIFTATTASAEVPRVAIVLTSAAKTSCPTAKLLSKVIHSTSTPIDLSTYPIHTPAIYPRTSICVFEQPTEAFTGSTL